jgi:ribosome-associated toxin RatA of RatAB toxin-antitoxin module
MREHHFVFRSAWTLPAPPERVYATLADVASYPRWWPQVKSAEPLDERSGLLTCRSALPYEITFRLTADVQDPERRTLRATLDGTAATRWPSSTRTSSWPARS